MTYSGGEPLSRQNAPKHTKKPPQTQVLRRLGSDPMSAQGRISRILLKRLAEDLLKDVEGLLKQFGVQRTDPLELLLEWARRVYHK